jgi:hypothetical protein
VTTSHTHLTTGFRHSSSRNGLSFTAPPPTDFNSLFRLTLLLALHAHSANPQPLTTGNLLVATSKSHDPDLADSVVLLIHCDSESAIGLVLNQPTSLPIGEVLRDPKDKSITVFAGGPVIIGVRGLLRSQAPPFFSVVSNRAELLKMVADEACPYLCRLRRAAVAK